MAESFQFPLQCVQFVKKKNGASRNVLVASAGPKLYTYAAGNGQRLAVWPQDTPSADSVDVPKSSDAGSNAENEGPPEKRRKVSTSSDQTVNAAPGEKATTWSSIPILTSTPDGEYVVALTAEDKNIRVFQIAEDGSFQQLSARPMPKRPCAITFTDKNDILSGDKFGDVYSLPLIPSAEPRIASKSASHPRPKVIAATPLTVHTQRNLRSLEMQHRQTSKKKEKATNADAPTFEHDLLLGHVSLLTDVAFVSLPSPDPSSNRKRTYLLSADRDEHIRVSRGPPQAHVIENYCFGHTSFISKLCIPSWAPEYLLSGGGDPYLLVWNWTAGQVLHKVPLVEEDPEGKDVAVRGIWATSLGADSSNPTRFILVALEGRPHLQCFTLETDGSMTPQTPIHTTGNVLDAQVGENGTIVISIDSVREAGSTQEWRSKPSSSTTLLEAFQLKGDAAKPDWEPVTDSALVNAVNATGTSALPANVEQKDRQALNNSLYSLENLRKKQYGVDE